MNDLNVKVGDKVIVYGPYGKGSIAVVVKVTPSGMFDAGGYRFKKNGMRFGGSKLGSVHAYECTEKEQDRINEQNFRRKTISRMIELRDVQRLSTDQLRRIASILDEGVER